MKKPSRFLRILGAASLVASLLVGAFGAATVSAQGLDDGLVAGDYGVFFPWVANDDESTGLGPADTSVTIQNLWDEEAIVGAFRGIGNDSLPGDNGWDLINPFILEPHASKTFSAAQLGIAEGEGAPIAFFGYMITGEITADCENAPFDLVDQFDGNGDGDLCDFETVADDDFLSGANSWFGGDVDWEDGDCLVVDIDDGEITDILVGGDGDVADLDGDPTNCVYSEAEAAGLGSIIVDPAVLAGVAKQAVDGENLPYTSDVDTVVSGYNGLSGFELQEVGNTDDTNPDGWYFPIVQTNGGPGGAWNSILRIANFGDGGGTIGAAGVNVTFYPQDNAAGELNQTFVRNLTINAGQTQMIDLSTLVPEGWIGSAHIAADAPVFAMVDRVKVGYNMWLTNTASNAAVSAAWSDQLGWGGMYVQFLPDVRKDWYGWNTGINVANISDEDTDVTIQYYGANGVTAQTREVHAKGMTYFYDPSQAPQDNNQQDPVDDTTTTAGEIGAAIILSEDPVVSVVDATKYPESTNSEDANIFQALSYSGTENMNPSQFVPLTQKGNPNTGMGATSGIQLFNPFDNKTVAEVLWFNSAGDVVGNNVPVVVNPNSMTFVYTMNDAQLASGYLGSAGVWTDFSEGPGGTVFAISTQVDYQVQYDGSAAWNGYNPFGGYRDGGYCDWEYSSGELGLCEFPIPGGFGFNGPLGGQN